jgi:uncharacterized protein YkwD
VTATPLVTRTTDADPGATPRRIGRRPARRLAAGGLVVVAALVLSACWSDNQQKALDFINSTRASYGRAAVNGDSQIMAKAQAWSEHMSRTGRLEHTGGGSRVDPSGISNWCAVAENVAVASTTWEAHVALVNSASHRTNLIGNYDRVGTGVQRVGDRVWLTQIFVRSC